MRKTRWSVAVALCVLLTWNVMSFVAAQGGSIDIGETITETATGDPVEFSIDLTSGRTVEIHLNSADFDPLLQVLNPEGIEIDNDDDDGVGLNSFLEFTAPTDGTYTIVVNSFNGQPESTFTLAVELPEGIGSDSDDEAAPAANGSGLSVGDTIMDSADGISSFAIDLLVNQTITISLASEVFDPKIEVLDASGTLLAEDDDGGEGLNSLLDFTAPAAGMYSIVVTAFGGNPQGEFTLELSGEIPEVTPDTPDVDSTEEGLAIGDAITGSADGDTLFEINLVQDQVITISLVSEVFDPKIEVLDASGALLAEDDDGGEGLNSLLDFTAPAADVYSIVVTAFGGDPQGEFTLSIMGDAPATSLDDSRLSVGDSVVGEAEEDVEFEIDLMEGQAIEISLTSSVFDTFIEVDAPSGITVAKDDDGGEGLNALLNFTAAEAGTHVIRVTSFGGAAQGEFTLSIAEGVSDATSASAPETDLTFGETVTVDPEGLTNVQLTFSAEEGTVVDISAVSSTDEDGELVLFSPSGQELIRDDDGGEGFEPFIRRFELPESGIYTIQLEEFFGDSLFDPFDITLTESELLDLDAGPVSVTLGEEVTVDVLTFSVVGGTTYEITIVPSVRLDSTLFVDVPAPGQDFADLRFSASGVNEFTATFAADENATMRLTLDYFAFDDPVTFTTTVTEQ